MVVVHAAVGNINVDIYLVVDDLPRPGENIVAREAYIGPGGAAANYSVAVRLYGHQAILVGHTSVFAERLGILDALRGKGVSLSLVRIHEGELPGIVVVLVTPNGERTMLALRGANNMLTGNEARCRCDVLHVASRDTNVLSNASTAASAELVSYDPGSSVARSEGAGIIEAARRHVSILYLNKLEYEYVTGTSELDSVARLLGGKLRYVVVKLGAEGALAATPDGVYRVEAYRHGAVVDPTGAGDVFAAYFNSALADGYSVTEALQYASVAAGVKVSRRGAQSAPSRREVEEIIASRPPRVWRIA
ncbi:carbohydrate kinase family protein [Hyperthermus butylicus]|uniref:Ribokinase n=1 Tax=Hyperthermus butylicus (strain DSM 5456 / JCM 9403 / PLM1-5) TaxID=415426 RepID=A2BLU3_HYPBU|nr:PfkB family carbohydrate kinase [Hyperthermus butylicus]ABM80954.1 ribokinase [Hyperthermus butylicus DSM 5456]